MTYSETLNWLFTQLPSFSRIGAPAYKPSLGNIEALCALLDFPQHAFPCIHVAGTNGKGSVTHLLASVLQSAGYKTGLYTSPHLKDFRERIRINGKMCSREFVVKFTQHIRTISEGLEPSFFEMTVAMAFDYFRQEQVDIAIIETGLGGRLDSTNIVTPLVSVITNIGMDHMQFLGNGLREIATEKAGIIKSGIPVVIGEYHADTWPVFVDKAAASKAELYLASHEWQVDIAAQLKEGLILEAKKNGNSRIYQYSCALGGRYQAKNVATVLTTLSVLPHYFKTSLEAITTGLAEVISLTGLHGRWERLATRPDLYVDVAHNEPGLEQLMIQIEAFRHKKLHLICGFVADKELTPMLKILPLNAQYYFTQAQIPRALDASLLQKEAARYELHGEVYKNIDEAARVALAQADPEDLIVIFGSIFLAGELTLLNV